MGIFIFIIQEKNVHCIIEKSELHHRVVQDRHILDEFLQDVFLREQPIKSTSAVKVSVFVEAQTLINKQRFPFALLSMCGGLTLAGCQVPTKAALSLPLLSWTGERK